MSHVISLEGVQRWVKDSEAAYDKSIKSHADMVRRHFVIPYCNRHNRYFVSGMGGYSFYDKDGEPVDASEKIEEILTIMTYNGHLGTWIEDYKPDNLK